jgi:hypothetical protein
MAKARRAQKEAVGGPYLDAALICERVLQDKDGTYSAIRMVNRITFHEQTFSPGTLILMPLTLVVSFKAGDTTDTRQLSLYVTGPSGRRAPLEGYVFPHPVAFAGGDAGVFMSLPNLPIRYETDGTYWIDVLLEKKRYSRLPLTVLTDRPQSSGAFCPGQPAETP